MEPITGIRKRLALTQRLGLVSAWQGDSYKDTASQLGIWVLSSGWWGGWEKALTKRARHVDSVLLDEDLKEKLIDDAREFMKSAEWYTDRCPPPARARPPPAAATRRRGGAHGPARPCDSAPSRVIQPSPQSA